MHVRALSFALLATLPWLVVGLADVTEQALARIRPAAGIAAVVCAAAAYQLTSELGLYRVRDFDWSHQPAEALARVPRGARLFHPFNFGSYLIYRGQPTVIDPRAATVYPEAYARAYYDALSDGRRLEQYLARGGYDAVLLAQGHKGTALALSILSADPRFVAVHRDDVAVLFVRRGSNGW